MDKEMNDLLEALLNKLEQNLEKNNVTQVADEKSAKTLKNAFMNALKRKKEDKADDGEGDGKSEHGKCEHLECKTINFFQNLLIDELETRGITYYIAYNMIVSEHIYDKQRTKEEVILNLAVCDQRANNLLEEGLDEVRQALNIIRAGIAGIFVSQKVVKKILDGEFDEYFK